VQPEIERTEVQEALGRDRPVEELARRVGVLVELVDLGRQAQDLPRELERRADADEAGRGEVAAGRARAPGDRLVRLPC